jgi:hypothetical protein
MLPDYLMPCPPACLSIMTNAGALLVITIGPAITITLGATLLWGLMYGRGASGSRAPGQRGVIPLKGQSEKFFFSHIYNKSEHPMQKMYILSTIDGKTNVRVIYFPVVREITILFVTELFFKVASTYRITPSISLRD